MYIVPYLVIAVSSLWPGYLAHPIDFQNLDSTMKTSFHNDVMKEDLDVEGHCNENMLGGENFQTDVMKEDLDVEGHEVVKDVSTDGGGSTEEAVSVTETKLLFHLRNVEQYDKVGN